MKNITTIAGLALAVTAMTASADHLLEVDLSVANQITIMATSGVSAVSASGGDTTGVYLENFFNVVGTNPLETLLSGNLTNAENPSDGTPNLFRAGLGSDMGLNIWSFSSDITVTFTAGSLAFTGSATWGLSASEYADFLTGNSSGDLYFPADDSGDLAGAERLGTWALVVPAPSSMALLGLGGLVCTRRRR